MLLAKARRVGLIPRSLMRILDRYLLRNFFEPFLMCFFGFIAIWLIFDLSDNGQDFIEAKASLKQVTKFYLTQLPQTILISLPIGLLLALLFSLSRMSRSNEIISMLTAGRSIVRILMPLFVIGIVASLGLMVLNYELAPHAEGIKKAALDQITKGEKKAGEIGTVEGYLFRDRMNNRTWFVKKMRANSPELVGVHVTQQDDQGSITKKWYSARATFNAKNKQWIFTRGMSVEFDSEGNITNTDDFTTSYRNVTGWTETPWRIASSHLEAQNLSVPELQQYLHFNDDFPTVSLAPYRTYLNYRWALPWSCLVVVFIAAPLGIVYSRRGVLAGVASSIFIFFGMIFVTNLCLALGKGSRVDPMLAAWFPNAFFGTIGMVLLFYRSTNRDFPTFGFKKRK